RPPTSTLFPYTTLFRSAALAADHGITKGLVDPPFAPVGDGVVVPTDDAYDIALERAAGQVDVIVGWNADEMSAFIPSVGRSAERSEEHTSELQSRENLV